MEERYIDEGYCDLCKKETRQEWYCAGHERDSSSDYRICLECGGFYSYSDGAWSPKVVSKSVPQEKIIVQKISFSPETIMGIHFRSFEDHKEAFVEAIRLAADEKEVLKVLSVCLNIMIEKYSINDEIQS